MKKNDIKILLIEDNPGDVRLVSEMLKECNLDIFKITHTGLVDEALEILKKEKFDVILVDLNLPDSYGFGGLERIITYKPESPVIVLTNTDDEITGIRAIEKHADDYLVKGQINANLLCRSIRYAIERKKTQESLRESQEHYRRLVVSSPEAIFVHSEGKIKFVNPAGVKLLGGLSKDGIINKPVLRLVPAEFRKMIKNLIRSPQTEKEEVRLIEMKLIRLDGRIIDVDITGISITYLGKPAIQLIARDISQRRRAEDILRRDKETLEKLVKERTKELLDTQAKLEHSKRLSDIGVLAATVAHELRNPLAGINLAIANIRRKTKEAALLERQLNTMEKKVVESDQIINNLLFYSRIKVSHLEDNISISDILEECIETSYSRSRKRVFLKKINFSSIKDIPIKADPLQIKELFDNILTNAYDAVSDGEGKIDVEVYPERESIKVCVKDNGIGISREHLKKVFDPFFTTKAKGTGLGLSVCQQIVSLHSGTINIESELNKGTSVTVTLPILHHRFEALP